MKNKEISIEALPEKLRALAQEIEKSFKNETDIKCLFTLNSDDPQKVTLSFTLSTNN